MKHLFVIITLTVWALNASAQTYLQHLQTREAGKGNVTVHQSREIDALVNGTSPMVAKPKPTIAHEKPESKESTTETKETAQKRSTDIEEDLGESVVVDTSKKIMRNAYKVTGYRVQVFAGGNSRKDKTKAEQIGNEVKSIFPGQPVYTHFYSPRWIVRMGNYRTYEEAQQVLKKIKAAGYNQACIVKGQITVQN